MILTMEIAEVVEYWLRLSENKWKTVEALMETGRYADALFFMHLSLEALLKAVVVEKTGEQAPRIHNLPNLALLAGLDIDDSQSEQLRDINTFNVRARYDDYKASLYKTATKEYTATYVDAAKQLRLWIQKNQQKKR